MSDQLDDLTQSQAGYLLAIQACSQEGPVRLSDLAAQVGVKTPSATRAVGTLVRMGLVTHEKYGGVELTPGGAEKAEDLMRSVDCLKRLFSEVIGLEGDASNVSARRLAHELDAESLQGLETLVEFSMTSPGWIRRLQHRVASKLGRKTDAS